MKIPLNFSNFSFGGWWGQPMSLFLKTGWWNSNDRTSGIHRCLYHNQKVVFRWPPRSSKYIKAIRKTLYTYESSSLSITAYLRISAVRVTLMPFLFYFVQSLSLVTLFESFSQRNSIHQFLRFQRNSIHQYSCLYLPQGVAWKNDLS